MTSNDRVFKRSRLGHHLASLNFFVQNSYRGGCLGFDSLAGIDMSNEKKNDYPVMWGLCLINDEISRPSILRCIFVTFFWVKMTLKDSPKTDHWVNFSSRQKNSKNTRSLRYC